ncbi:hypothetical protein B0H34DRAFT_617158, partial [Crassisporium funariophilum]
LLGLTAYRVHHTKDSNYGQAPDYNKTHFYVDSIIVELLVTSILSFLISLWFLSAILGRVGRGPLGKYATEHLSLFIIWTMFLVGSAITTHKWRHLKYCRGSSKQCRILETIKAFAWICWILTTFLILASLANMTRRKHGWGGPVHGRDDAAAYPDTRSAAYPETRTVQPAT